MEREALAQLIERGLTQRDIAKETNRSQASVKHWLRKHKLKTKRATAESKCYLCGETDRSKMAASRRGRKSFICRACDTKRNREKCQRIKRERVAAKGGACQRCGYNKCLAALHFHHRDPTKKDPDWKQARNWSEKRIREELDKCDLLCANCHAEIHAEIA